MTDLQEPSSSRTPIVLAIAIFAGLSLAAAITSEGFLEADACTHYLYARFAFDQPHFFFNIWGRPICTALYSIPAVIGGRLGVRVTSLLLAIGCGLVVYRIARNQGYRWPAVALIFTFAQPLVFLHSFSELTELPFALLLGLGFLAFQQGRWLAMAILIGLTPLSRPEGFGFLILALAAVAIYRRWWAIPILLIPLIGWSFFGWLTHGSQGDWWKWLIDNWPWSDQSAYKPGPIWHFAMFLPVFAGPIAFPFMLIGVGRTCMDKGGRKKDEIEPSSSSFISHPSYFVCRLLILAIPLMIFVAHSLLYFLGKLASNGELRYMLIVAPFWGLLSAGGWEWVFTRTNWSGVYRWAGVVALAPALANPYYRVVPIRWDADSLNARRTVEWYEHSPLARAFPRVATAHQMVYYFMGMINTDRDRALQWDRDHLGSPVAGTIVFWDPIYAVYNSDGRRIVPIDDLLVAGWLDITGRVPATGKGWHVLLSPTDAQGRDATETLRSLSSP